MEAKIKMMRAEGKATRSANRSSPWKSSYVAYGLLLGSLLVLLYLMVSTQFSYSQKGIMINPPLLLTLRVKKLYELKEQGCFMINLTSFILVLIRSLVGPSGNRFSWNNPCEASKKPSGARHARRINIYVGIFQIILCS